jgi:pimeloyl-ACP methyl ester carboxylesterase
VRAIIEALDCGAVTGIGSSRGSNLLMWVAAEYPALIKRLVLLGTPVDDSGPDSEFPRPIEAALVIRQALEAGDLPRVIEEFCRSLFSEPDVDDLVDIFIRGCKALPPETFLDFFKPDPEADVRPFLARIKAPTLVMQGTADRRVNRACGPYIAEHIKGARFYPVEGKGHVALYSAAREFCQVVRDFLGETGG